MPKIGYPKLDTLDLKVLKLVSGKNMELVSKIVDAATRALNNNTVINVCLVASFATLGIRSLNQQKLIEALEAEKEKLVKSNKAMRNTMWDWKQQLFAEASSDSALVPLARLQAIYGEAPLPEHATPGNSNLSVYLCYRVYSLSFVLELWKMITTYSQRD